ncbi:MAG TPA: FtsX-like permease family protein, partial [Gemmataceae bacterium]|nr:FtsX-like permease family protein [Gemmataceae bacterium]
ISHSLAQRLFPSGDAIGNHLLVGAPTQPQDSEIVGIVNDARIRDFLEPWPYIVYTPYFQRPLYTRSWTNVEMLVTDASPGLMEAARERIDSLGREYVLMSGPLEEVIDTGLAGQRSMAYVAAFFAGLALLLAAIGLYGLMSYTVSRRTQEIGIRMALGGQRMAILRMVLSETFLVILSGLAVGLPCALSATRLVAHMLFGLSPGDPPTLAMAAAALAAVGVLAGYLPARRATRVGPMVALRYE